MMAEPQASCRPAQVLALAASAVSRPAALSTVVSAVIPAALILLMTVLAGIPPVLAADAARGREAAGQCAVCHGKNGLATMPEAPNLAGESAIYIEKQLMAFKRGERQHRQMSLIAAGLEDQTIKDLGAWYESMQVSVTLPD